MTITPLTISAQRNHSAPVLPLHPTEVHPPPRDIPHPTSLPPLPHPDPARPDLTTKLFSALFDPDLSITDLAEQFKLHLSTIALWAQLPEVRQRAEAIADFSVYRAGLLTRVRTAAAIHTLDRVTMTDLRAFGSERDRTRAKETARKAATTILHLGLRAAGSVAPATPRHEPLDLAADLPPHSPRADADYSAPEGRPGRCRGRKPTVDAAEGASPGGATVPHALNGHLAQSTIDDLLSLREQRLADPTPLSPLRGSHLNHLLNTCGRTTSPWAHAPRQRTAAPPGLTHRGTDGYWPTGWSAAAPRARPPP